MSSASSATVPISLWGCAVVPKVLALLDVAIFIDRMPTFVKNATLRNMGNYENTRSDRVSTKKSPYHRRLAVGIDVLDVFRCLTAGPLPSLVSWGIYLELAQ